MNNKLLHATVLLPCHSLDDFPVHVSGADGDGILSAWSALWHPRLIAATGRLPSWHRADEPPELKGAALVVIPAVSEPLLPDGWVDDATRNGAVVVRAKQTREEICQVALDALGESPSAVGHPMTADFWALGFCYLQIELLTRQMRYTSNVDLVHLENQLVPAAQELLAEKADEAREHLTRCFNSLAEARDHFYPVNVYLIDLTLAAPTTTGASLIAALDTEFPVNLLITGNGLEKIAEHQPDVIAAIRAAVAANRCCIVGGEEFEGELPLQSMESVLDNLKNGMTVYETRTSLKPSIFARRRYGLSPLLPGLLSRLGFTGALHFTLDDGRFPEWGQSKARWEGADGSMLETMFRIPMDAAQTQTFLRFPERLARTMDLDHVATLTFAHWPGQTCEWMEDIYRAARYNPILGKFVTLQDYFRDTDTPYEVARLKPDQYRSPYLAQDVSSNAADPISRRADGYREHFRTQAANTARTIVSLITGRHVPPISDNQPDPKDAANAVAAAVRPDGSGSLGSLIVNTASFRRSISVRRESAGDYVRVEVPAMGFAWVADEERSPIVSTSSKPLAEGNILRNQHLEVVIHPESGGIQAIRIPNKRGNRLSQQLALRIPAPPVRPGEAWRDPDESCTYSEMKLDGMEVTSSGPVLGEILTTGRLLDREGRRVAGFRQTTGLFFDSRVVSIDIELDVDEPLRADPWESYYAARFAWSDAAADLRRSLHGTSVLTESRRIEAPEFVEINTASTKASVLTCGYPFHRAAGSRMLDSMLVVRGETRRKFHLAVAIDSDVTAQAAQGELLPIMAVPNVPAPTAAGKSGWLFHLDVKNLLATNWEPLCEDEKITGIRVRLLETEGRSGRACLRTFRPVGKARQTDLIGNSLGDVTVNEDRLLIDYGGHEWLQLEMEFC